MAEDLGQSAVSVLSCVWILLIISLSGILFVFVLAWKYKSFRVPSSDGRDSWLTFALLCGSLLAHSSIFPFAARVYALVQIPTSIKTETQIQLAIWLLSVGCSLIFGSQAILAWKRWKIQNSYLNIRHQYLALILCMVVLVDVSQLTLWSSTDPFRCPTDSHQSSRAADSSLVFCDVHYLPLWLLSNFLHKGVLIFTATVYSWRLQLLSTSLSILRSISGCSLLASSATVISIAMLSPLVYMANESPALQHLCLSLAILLAIGSTSILHFIPKILTAHVHREQQVQVRQASMGDLAASPLFPEVHGGLKKVTAHSELRRPSASVSSHQNQQQQQNLVQLQHRRESSSINGNNRISFMNPDRLENLLKVPESFPHKKSIRVGSSRELMMKARQHHKSMFQLGYTAAAGYPSSDSHHEISRQSQCQSSASSSRQQPNHQPQQIPKSQNRHSSRQNLKYKKAKLPENNSAIQQLSNPLNTRIRKSFSMNDMKAFLRDTKRSDAMILDSRAPEPVAYTSENLLRPLISLQPATVETTESASPNSTSRQGSAVFGAAPLTDQESTSLASKMWLTPSILRSNPINFIRLGSVTSQMSIKQTDNPVII